jgi:hypothetical protein
MEDVEGPAIHRREYVEVRSAEAEHWSRVRNEDVQGGGRIA